MNLLNLKIAFHTLGCKVNAYETEVMEQQCRNEGAVIVSFQEKADVYVINTCSVTNIADRKSRQMLHRAKKENPEAVIVACGCYAQVETAEKLHETGVDLIIDNDKKGKLAECLYSFISDRIRAEVADIGAVKEFESMTLENTSEHTRAYLKVQDGCNQFCSYCIIPYARGRIRSKKPEEVLREVEILAANGVKEFVLTGIHLSSYGKDLEEDENLISLIEKVHAVEGVRRIRLGSLEPRIVTEEFAARLASLDKICPHFHLSLQSGSAATLKRMNRHYTPEEYLAGAALLRKYFREPAITTDVIVGFPGETEENFRESLDFVRRVGFYEMHVFQYSRRKGTAADRMPDQIPEPVKKKRSEEMIRLGKEMSDEYRRAFLGKEVSVLAEEIQEIGGVPYMMGYTREYIRAALPASTPENEIVTAAAEDFLTEEIMNVRVHA